MSWICKDCKKRKNRKYNKCDFLTNNNCYTPNLKAKLMKIFNNLLGR